MWLRTDVIQFVSEPVKTTTLPCTVQILIYGVAEINWRAYCSEQGGKSAQPLTSKHELHHFTIAFSLSDRCAFFGNYQQLSFCLFIVKSFGTTD